MTPATAGTIHKVRPVLAETPERITAGVSNGTFDFVYIVNEVCPPSLLALTRSVERIQGFWIVLN